MTQRERQKGSKLLLAVLIVVWLSLLIGILGNRQYIEKHPPSKQVDKPTEQQTK